MLEKGSRGVAGMAGFRPLQMQGPKIFPGRAENFLCFALPGD
jgi:hypothetical protein